MSDTRLERALCFDRWQAEQIADFLADQLIQSETSSFRLMPDMFAGSLDLTSFDPSGKEITHIHPRGWDMGKLA